MGYSRKLGPPIVSASVATIVLTNFATVTIVRGDGPSSIALFNAIWPIALTSAVAIVLVMSFLYRSLVELVVELERREEAAQHQALHDQLTGLANRALLEDRLDQALGHCRRQGGKVSLMMLDLDRFKQVNDTLGHSAGDQMVRDVAARLASLLRETDTIARIGGDEFAIVAADIKGEADVRRLCEKIIAAIREPFILNGKAACVGASVGAVIDGGGGSGAELLRKADITMYKAKSAGRDCFRIYSEEMDADVQRRDQLEGRLRSALGNGRGIELNFQPTIRSATGQVEGVEALLRWRDPVLGAVSPGEIIPIAEECGLMEALGDAIFNQACAVAHEWPSLSIAVNLSPVQFRDPDFPERLARMARAEGVRCAQFELEITETLFMEHGEIARSLEALRASGFRLALDDFGTGYSSLSYLRQFEVDTIKLDRSFIETAREAKTVAIIKAAVALGHSMGLTVVAEGISDREQEKVALEAGCDALQGYLYSPPLSQTELGLFLSLDDRFSLAGAA